MTAPGDKKYTITYSGGKITKITDGAGKTATLEYTSSNYLNKIVCDNKAMSFSYTNGYLTKITYPDGTYTEFQYSGDRLIRVKDRSGYRLVYEYTDIGKVSGIREEVANETIGSTVTPVCCGIITGDCWNINYLHSLQTQVKNRNGLVMEYIFDADGNTVTMFEDDRTSASSQKFSVCGKAIYKQSLVAEGKEESSSYKTRIQTGEATLYAQENLVNPYIENWPAKL